MLLYISLMNDYIHASGLLRDIYSLFEFPPPIPAVDEVVLVYKKGSTTGVAHA